MGGKQMMRNETGLEVGTLRSRATVERAELEGGCDDE